MSKYKIIVNPVSGRGDGARSEPRIDELLHAGGLDFDLVRTKGPGDAMQLARSAAVAGYDVVVAVGGDGTSNEVLNGLMEARDAGSAREVCLGIIAVGRGNDFAYGVGIPPGVDTGCQLLVSDQRRMMDVGKVVGGLYPEGRYFGNGVGIGFDAVVGFEAQKLKRLSGFPSYIVATLMTVFLYFQAPVLHIEFDGQVLEQPSLLVSVMNGRRMGGGFLMAPLGDPSDGLLDLCIARQVSKAGVFALVPRFMKGTQATHPHITTARAKRVEVTAIAGTLPAHADGETLCTEGHRLLIELLPQQLQVISEAREP
jgi:diacylglycerol kinase (ATP)